MKNFLCILTVFASLGSSVRAVVPEPDSILYGLAYAGTNQISQVTAANTNIVIEARRTPTGPSLASYTMGARAAVGDYYSLRLSLESVVPISANSAFQSGETFYLTMTDAGSVRAQMPLVVGARGQITRVDFKSSNFPADWLTRLKHPADNAPADSTITSAEADAYARAWKSGQSWPIEPNPIPIGYATRAGAIWLGGGSYVFDPTRVTGAPTNNPAWWATNAPLWWTTTVPATSIPSGNSVVRALPATYQPNVPLVVTATVKCIAATGVYAVEDQPPTGWKISNISDSGAVDPINLKIKWGPFFDNTSRVLSYTLTPPPTASGDVTFAGQGGFDGQPIAITGQSETGPTPAGNLSLLSLNFGRQSGFQIHLKGSPGDSQTVDVSTNLTQWITLTNIVFDANGLGALNDPAATNYTRRFYRILEP